MKLTTTLTINGAAVPVELDVPGELLAPPALLDDPGLRRRWHASARTLGRIRKGGLLAFTQPSPGKYLYAIADVEGFEASQRTEARPLVRVARRAS